VEKKKMYGISIGWTQSFSAFWVTWYVTIPSLRIKQTYTSASTTTTGKGEEDPTRSHTSRHISTVIKPATAKQQVRQG
jgi:hypothetical protein